jgi:hypothetical protein
MLDNIPIFVNASLIILYQSSLLVKYIVPGYFIEYLFQSC